MLIKNGIKYSENRNGVFINMNFLSSETLEEIKLTLLYIREQEKTINDIELLKSNLNKIILKIIIKRKRQVS